MKYVPIDNDKINIKNIKAKWYRNLISRPSLNIGNKNAKKIIAVPGSGCIAIKNIGIRIIKEIKNKSLFLDRSVWIILRYFAKKRLVVILTNSEGWKLMNPRSYHDLAPPAFMPKMNNPRRRIIEIK